MADLTGYQPDVAVDSTGQFHYVWGNRIKGIRYQKGDGTIVTLPPPGYNPAIAVDTQNRPHVVWHAKVSDTTFAIYYSHWDGVAWTPALRLSSRLRR